jgi:hypothetical protein
VIHPSSELQFGRGHCRSSGDRAAKSGNCSSGSYQKSAVAFPPGVIMFGSLLRCSFHDAESFVDCVGYSVIALQINYFPLLQARFKSSTSIFLPVCTVSLKLRSMYDLLCLYLWAFIVLKTWHMGQR